MNFGKTKKRNKLILIALLLMISLGYALLNANLRINGSSKIKNSSWDIHWNNVQVTSGSVSVGIGDSAAAIKQNDTTEVNYTVTLNKPGDFYEFTVDAVNAGSIDAMIDVITSTYKIGEGEVTTITSSNLPAYLDYSVSYSDGTLLERYQELKAGESETYKVRVEYKKDITENDLPSTEQSIAFRFTVDYKQADDNAIEVQHQTVGPIAPVGNYVVSNIEMYMGQAVPNGVMLRTTPELAMADWASITGTPGDTRPFYLKHTIENDIITESYLELIITDELKAKLKSEICYNDSSCIEKVDKLVNGTYSLKGNDGDYYTINKGVISQAFGQLLSDNIVCDEDSNNFSCSLASLRIDINKSGNVDIMGFSSVCAIYSGRNAYSYCH